MNAVLFLFLVILGLLPISAQIDWGYWRGPPRVYRPHLLRGLHPHSVVPLQVKRQRCLKSGCVCEDPLCSHCSCFAPIAPAPRIRYWHRRHIQHIEVPYGELPTTTPVIELDEEETTPGICVGDNKNVIIQFVLVQDVTYSYKPFIDQLASIMPDFLKTLADEFPETEFALTTFVDYPYLTTMQLSPDAYCYRLEQPLTKDHSKITDAISKFVVQTGGNDGPEASLTGILYSAVDSKIGWAKEKTLRGKKVIKVIAMTTDERWKEKNDPGGFPPPPGHPDPKGDGTDTCNNGLPSATLVKKVLEDRDFYLLGLIAPQMKSTWEGYLDLYKFNPENSRLISLSVSDANTLAASLVEQFSKIVYEDKCGVAETTEPPQMF